MGFDSCDITNLKQNLGKLAGENKEVKEETINLKVKIESLDGNVSSLNKTAAELLKEAKDLKEEIKKSKDATMSYKDDMLVCKSATQALMLSLTDANKTALSILAELKTNNAYLAKNNSLLEEFIKLSTKDENNRLSKEPVKGPSKNESREQ